MTYANENSDAYQLQQDFHKKRCALCVYVVKNIQMKIENIIFDFGGVLVDWNPRYLYRNYFKDESEMEHFLHFICTDAWNLEQDRGRPLAEGTRLLQNKFPEYHSLIKLYYDKWEVMLHGDIRETVSLLYQLKEKYKIFGLTNWSRTNGFHSLKRSMELWYLAKKN